MPHIANAIFVRINTIKIPMLAVPIFQTGHIIVITCPKADIKDIKTYSDKSSLMQASSVL
jgi:hypothetical protein